MVVLNELDSLGLDEYLSNAFVERNEDNQDMSFLDFWKSAIEESKNTSACEVINARVCPRRPVDFEVPENVRIELYDSIAGEIPIIYCPARNDFESLITNLVHKGVRPDNIGETGASFIFGKSTRFIVLSAKPYSNVTAKEMGLKEDDWARKSMVIRREHECVHYYTKMLYGCANNNIHDEIMADFIGIYEAFGEYRAEWFLRFMGIIEGSGNRIQCYSKELNEPQLERLKQLVVVWADSLEAWSKSEHFTKLNKKQRIDYLCGVNLDKRKDIGMVDGY